MKDNSLTLWTKSAQPIIETLRTLNELMVASLEKTINLQLDSLQAYADLTISQLKAGVEIKDMSDLKDYAIRQGDLAKVVNDKLVKDTRTLTEIGAQFNADVVKLVQSQVDAAVKKAA